GKLGLPATARFGSAAAELHGQRRFFRLLPDPRIDRRHVGGLPPSLSPGGVGGEAGQQGRPGMPEKLPPGNICRISIHDSDSSSGRTPFSPIGEGRTPGSAFFPSAHYFDFPAGCLRRKSAITDSTVASFWKGRPSFFAWAIISAAFRPGFRVTYGENKRSGPPSARPIAKLSRSRLCSALHGTSATNSAQRWSLRNW